MINDCAYVGETLLKYLPADMEKEHIKRTRGLLTKTFGLAYQILSADGDVYHVHYLLQDCYIATRLGKRPLIGHAHGSDIRASLNHPLWGRMVKHNLQKCNTVLVSTPDLLETARQSRDDAKYLPNPVDTKLFYRKPLVPHSGRKQVLIASDANWSVKGTDVAVRALSKIKDEIDVNIVAHGADIDRTIALASSLGLRLNALPKMPHERFSNCYWNADVVVDGFRLGSLGMVSLEAIACGRPVVVYVSSQYHEYADFPLKDINTEEEIVNAVQSANSTLWSEQYAYLQAHHEPQEIARRILDIYGLTTCQS